MHWAYCGYDCERCPVYRASGDPEQQRLLAQRYASPERPLQPEQMRCRGCRSAMELPCVMCAGCAIRRCAIRNGVESCGYCVDYPCDGLNRALPPGSESRKRLDQLATSAKREMDEREI